MSKSQVRTDGGDKVTVTTGELVTIFRKSDPKTAATQVALLQQHALEQRETLDKLPQCWGLLAGKLVRGCPVVPGMTIYRKALHRVLAYVVHAVLRDTITATHGRTGCILEPGDCANSPEAAEALGERSDDV